MISKAKESARQRRRLITRVKESLRTLNNQLSLFNRQVGAHVVLKDADYDCLELLNQDGPSTPTALARHAGMHPATMTGILDRLQRGGWVVRERAPDAADRRAITIRAVRDRNAELFELFSGMNSLMDGICTDYSDEELQLIASFLERTASAGRDATEKLRDT